MIFAFNNTGVEMTVEELCVLIDSERFDDFFDFLLDLEEESFFHKSLGEKVWEVELSQEQEDKFLEKALMNWEEFEMTNSDEQVNEMTEEELLQLLFGDNKELPAVEKKEAGEGTELNEKLMRFIRRLG